MQFIYAPKILRKLKTIIPYDTQNSEPNRTKNRPILLSGDGPGEDILNTFARRKILTNQTKLLRILKLEPKKPDL